MSYFPVFAQAKPVQDYTSVMSEAQTSNNSLIYGCVPREPLTNCTRLHGDSAELGSCKAARATWTGCMRLHASQS